MSAPWSPSHNPGTGQAGSNSDWAASIIFAIAAVPFALAYLMVALLFAPVWVPVLAVVRLRHGDVREAIAYLATAFVLVVGLYVASVWLRDPSAFLYWLLHPFAGNPVTSP